MRRRRLLRPGADVCGEIAARGIGYSARRGWRTAPDEDPAAVWCRLRRQIGPSALGRIHLACADRGAVHWHICTEPVAWNALPQDSADGANLRGRVIDAISGKPVAGASVRAQYITGIENPPRCPIGDCEVLVDPRAGRIPVYRVTTAADGSFDIRGIKPGDYDVAAVAPGYTSATSAKRRTSCPRCQCMSPRGRAPHQSRFGSTGAGSLSGRIFSDAGDGLAGVEVELLRRRYNGPSAHARLPSPSRRLKTWGRSASSTFLRASTTFGRTPHGRWLPHEEQTCCRYTATFFPDATDVTLAQPVLVGARTGTCRGGFHAWPLPGNARSAAGLSIRRAAHWRRRWFLCFRYLQAEDLKAPVAADGRFRVDRRARRGLHAQVVLDTSNAAQLDHRLS